jgi:uncharacterized membrane-anchored protein
VRRSFIAVAVVLPLVVLVLGMVSAERRLGDNRRWTFAVTGYDPRDLLRGHYIQYRLVTDETDLPPLGRANGRTCDETIPGDCCLCLTENVSGEPALLEWTTCTTAFDECEGAMQTQYLNQLQRYYIAEANAEWLTELFQDASREHRAQLVVAIDKLGRPQIDTLLIDDMPIEQAEKPADDKTDQPAGEGNENPAAPLPAGAPK